VTPALWIVSNEGHREPKPIYVQQASYVVLALCMSDQKKLHKDVGAVFISLSEDVAQLQAKVISLLCPFLALRLTRGPIHQQKTLPREPWQ
jgi:hypothetical protein